MKKSTRMPVQIVISDAFGTNFCSLSSWISTAMYWKNVMALGRNSDTPSIIKSPVDGDVNKNFISNPFSNVSEDSFINDGFTAVFTSWQFVFRLVTILLLFCISLFLIFVSNISSLTSLLHFHLKNSNLILALFWFKIF